MKFASSLHSFSAAAAATSLSLLVINSGSVYGATNYTNDVLDGYPVITQLDVSDLDMGMHRFWFRATEDGIGGYHHVPVMIAKGSQDGTVLYLQSSIHGDELQGTQVIHDVFNKLGSMCLQDGSNASDAMLNTTIGNLTQASKVVCDVTEYLTGTVVAVIGSNPTGMLQHSRTARYTTDGMTATNLNRVMPGSNTSSDAGEHYAYALWHYLYGSNPDIFLDLHTQSRGTSYPFFIYSDRRDEMVDRLVQLMPADIVKDDVGEPGTVETEMVFSGVPAMTIELGEPKMWNKEMSARAVQGIMNTMFELSMMEGTIDLMNYETYYANDLTSIRADRGGYGEILVELNEDVTQDQLIALQYNAFGDVIREYTAPWDGRVLSIGTDPIREPGALMVRLVRQLDDAE